MSFLPGDRVSHPMYGSGVVEIVFNNGRLAIVRFGDDTAAVPTARLDKEATG